MLHTCLLLLAGTTSAILRAGLVELPIEVDEERAAGGVGGREFADAVDDGLGLVSVQNINAANIKSQLSETAEVEVVLHAKCEVESLGGDAEVVVVALRGPLGVGSQSETVAA